MIKVDAGRLWRRDYPLHAKPVRVVGLAARRRHYPLHAQPVGVVWLAARLAASVVPHRGGTRLSASSLRKRLRSPPAGLLSVISRAPQRGFESCVMKHAPIFVMKPMGAEDKPDFVHGSRMQGPRPFGPNENGRKAHPPKSKVAGGWTRPIRALIGVIHLSGGKRGCVTPSKV